ncbi:MAG: rhodanese-like domain-containing protein [Gammaproteobacteria bacterium]|nr:rhodanese-like domain-containing protein [Gammaproteobacteria bacterium]MBL7000109.1 rhodanese-like domain-containing protein [Gammaproteobacteria bacterium]
MTSINKLLALWLLGLFISTPLLASEVSPLQIDGATTIRSSEAKALFDQGILFVDVRSDADWEAGRIPGAIHLDVKKTLSEATLSAEASRDDKIVIYCNGEKCLRSAEACILAVSWGFTQINYFREGFPAWKAGANPTE